MSKFFTMSKCQKAQQQEDNRIMRQFGCYRIVQTREHEHDCTNNRKPDIDVAPSQQQVKQDKRDGGRNDVIDVECFNGIVREEL